MFTAKTIKNKTGNNTLIILKNFVKKKKNPPQTLTDTLSYIRDIAEEQISEVEAGAGCKMQLTKNAVDIFNFLTTELPVIQSKT